MLNVGCGENERHEFIDCKAATGDKKHINLILNGLCKFDYFLNLGRAFNNIGCAETVLNSNIVAAFSTDCIKKLNCKAAAVLEALSAVFISSLVENGVKEKRGELTVSTVNIHNVSAGFHSVACRNSIVLNELLDFFMSKNVNINIHGDTDRAFYLVGAEIGSDRNKLNLCLCTPASCRFHPLRERNNNVWITHTGNMMAGCRKLLVDETTAHCNNGRATLCKGNYCFNTFSGDVIIVSSHEVPLRSTVYSVLQSNAAVAKLQRLCEMGILCFIHFYLLLFR